MKRAPFIAALLATLAAGIAAAQATQAVPATPALPALPALPPIPAEAPALLAQAASAHAEADQKYRAERAAERARQDALRRELRRAPSEDEALALAALEGLMSVSADRALPLLKKVLAGNQSTLVKGRALFVLSQIDKPEAHAALVDFAKGNRGNPLTSEAIRVIGIGGNNASLAALRDIYAGGDEATRADVMQAWQIAGRKAEVYQAALNAKSDSEADRAIMALSTMGAREELRKLGEQRKTSKSLMEAYAIAGDLASLKRIADTATDPQVKIEAVRRMGIIAGNESRQALRDIYASNTDAKVRQAALNGMQIAGDQQGVLALYRGAKTPEEKRSLLRTLSVMGGDAALEAIDQALEGKK